MDPEKLAEEIANASVMELNSAMKVLEEKYGIKVQAPVAVGAAPATSSAEASAVKEEKTSFNVELKAVGEKKIEVIKVVRDVTGKGLKEAKDLVDAAASAPQMVKENAKKEEAEEMKKKFEAAGATVELK
ncbi:MAG: 50S ribosomal protein L7/L12 [Candidatus Nealsonbacteria bacterium]|nr:50S ribosomal protein L7/L12 [Candidatus Nealsonbacteria bacterium]